MLRRNFIISTSFLIPLNCNIHNPQYTQLRRQQGLQDPSQMQYSQNPQNTQLQRQQSLQDPMNTDKYNYQHQQFQQHPSLPQQEQNQVTRRQPKQRRKAAKSKDKPQQQEVKRNSRLPAPQPHLVPQSSNQRSQQSNVPKDEMAKNSMVGQFNHQESKQTLLNAKLEQTRSSISVLAQDTAKRDMGSIEIDMKKDNIKELKNTQSPTSSLFQGALESELGPIKNDMEEANIEEGSNRNVGSIRLDMKEAQNEQLEKVSAVFQFTASRSVKEVVNREGDST